MPMSGELDIRYMRLALALARRGLGQVAPNPSVGCVLVRQGHIVGRGWTQPGGRPHGETEALGRAGSQSLGATAYVNLEPCAHRGKTPPCADALVRAGVVRVVYALRDPDPRVAGRGVAVLTAAGISVTAGVCETEARQLNAGFLRKITARRPFVTLKLATSLDGRIATGKGESKWITGENARARGHLLRAQNDVIMIGAGTLRADNPSLTCRLPGLAGRSPVRLVVANKGEGLAHYDLMRTAGETPTWLFCQEIEPASAKQLADFGVRVEQLGGAAGVDLAAVLRRLGEAGKTRLLVEGGGTLAASLLDLDLVDEIYIFRSGLVIGGAGRPAIAALQLDELAALTRFDAKKIVPCDKDFLEILSKPD